MKELVNSFDQITIIDKPEQVEVGKLYDTYIVDVAISDVMLEAKFMSFDKESALSKLEETVNWFGLKGEVLSAKAIFDGSVWGIFFQIDT